MNGPGPDAAGSFGSGGQASVLRLLLAASAAGALVVAQVEDATGGAAAARLGNAAACTVVAVLLALGWRIRECALALMVPTVILAGRVLQPLPGPLALLAALALLALLPPAPVLSLAAAGRADPRGDFRWPRWVAALALGAALAVDGWWLLGPHALGWSWLPALTVLHLLALPLTALAPRSPGPDALLLFDGDCALCHGTVRWLLAEDRAGLLAVAPLQGSTAAARLSPGQRAALPDSLVLLVQGHESRMRSDAVAALMAACGGLWRPLAQLLTLVPRPLRDGGYALVASWRLRVFGKASAACPLLPPDLATRLLP